MFTFVYETIIAIFSFAFWFSYGLFLTLPYILLLTLSGVGILLWKYDADILLFFCEKFGKKIATLKGQVVWVTGASSGIGKHLALLLAKHGVKLVLSARRVAELEEVKKLCHEQNSSLEDTDILVLPLDVTNYDAHKPCLDKILDHFGQLDILVNNAGRSQRAEWCDIDINVDKEMFDLNVFSGVALARLVVKHFKDVKHGHVAVMSSVAGKYAIPCSATYCATKFALQGYYDCLRNEVAGSRIYITLLCPGPVFSNFLSECFTSKQGEKYGQTQQKTDIRMSTDRCAEICAIGLANRSDEVWMGLYPWVPMMYATAHFPYICNRVMAFIGVEKMMKLRDSRNTMKND